MTINKLAQSWLADVKRLRCPNLRVAATDLRRHTNGEWEAMLDDLYFAIVGAKRGETEDRFSLMVKDRVPVWTALEDSNEALKASREDENIVWNVNFQN